MTAQGFLDGRVTLHAGDCLDVLASLPEASVDSAVCDPPYGLEFMGKDWDSFGKAPTGGAAFTTDGMGKGFKALPSFTGSPNPSCINCGGSQRGNDRKGFTRCRCDSPAFPNTKLKQMRAFGSWCETWAVKVFRVLKPGGHLVAFSGTRTYHRMVCAIEDAGFEVRDQIGWAYGSGFPKSHNAGNGWGTALKPAWEPVVLARKPLIGTVAANVEMHGTGAINVDGCRVAGDEDGSRNRPPSKLAGDIYAQDEWTKNTVVTRNDTTGLGRWPANIVHDGSEEVLKAFPETQSGAMKHEVEAYGGEGVTGFLRGRSGPSNQHGDAGSAARFFYTAKADAEDRLGSKHPTVKPLDLMQWLVRLVTPKRVLSCPQCHPWGNDDSAEKTSPAESLRGMRSDVPPEGQPTYGPVLQPPMRVEGAGAETASVRVVRGRVSAASGRGAEVLRSGLREPPHGEQSGQPQGISNQQEGLQADLDAASPALESAGRIPVRASVDNGASHRSASASKRGRASQKRDQNGQPAGELGTDAEGGSRQAQSAEAEHAQLPPLSGQDHHEPTCSRCGHRLEWRPGVCLDPFAGTGTTGEAAWREGMRAILIEREAEYQADIARRMDLAANPTKRAAVAKTKNNLDKPEDLPLFSGVSP